MPDHPPTIACIQGKPVSRTEFLAEARRIADQLPDQAYAVNLCQDRYLFALGLVACLSRGIVTLLPPDRGSRQLAQIEQTHPGALILTDRATETVHKAWLLQRPDQSLMPTTEAALSLPDDQVATWQWKFYPMRLSVSFSSLCPRVVSMHLRAVLHGAQILGLASY